MMIAILVGIILVGRLGGVETAALGHREECRVTSRRRDLACLRSSAKGSETKHTAKSRPPWKADHSPWSLEHARGILENGVLLFYLICLLSANQGGIAIEVSLCVPKRKAPCASLCPPIRRSKAMSGARAAALSRSSEVSFATNETARTLCEKLVPAECYDVCDLVRRWLGRETWQNVFHLSRPQNMPC